MTVLWIILGIFAGILLLLCVPLKLSLSWDKPNPPLQETASWLTPQTEQEIKKMGLEPEDEQILRQTVWELGAQNLPEQNQLTARLQYLFLHFSLYPFPQKRKAVKQIKSKQKKESSEAPKEKKDSEGIDPKAMLKQVLPQLMRALKKAAEMILNDLCLYRLSLKARIVREDCAAAALAAQKLQTSAYTALALAQNWVRVKKANLQIVPDFTGKEESELTFSCCVGIRPIVLIRAGGTVVFALVRAIFLGKKKQTKSSAPSSKPDGTDTDTEQRKKQKGMVL